MRTAKKREFTGKHMAITMVAGFGIVAAVNFFMAYQAVGGFHGIVVENSYVASQKFNEWKDEADRMAALGWTATPMREASGHVIVTTTGVPEGAALNADLRRPIGTKEFATLTFAPTGDGQFRSLEPVADGRWTLRLSIEAAGQKWAEESEL
ncbi:MAG: FixH family protein [Pseudomonadota bacterium]